MKTATTLFIAGGLFSIIAIASLIKTAEHSTIIAPAFSEETTIKTTSTAEIVANTDEPTQTEPPTTEPKSVRLSVPHIWEIPDGRWVKPWNGACEEASIMMVDLFYRGTAQGGIIPTSTAKKLMAPLFPVEDKLFGSNSDTDAARTAQLINGRLAYTAEIKKHPTLDDILHELQNGHPVISMHYGYGLNNPHHAFRQGGSSYHVMVITGYDDNKRIFFVNDPELQNGLDYSYAYDTIITTLHDFDYSDKKADGPPVVLLTKPSQE